MIKFIVAPLLGGIIGYITNDIAIKMLFHPRKSVYIGKFHIPFTPGLIPQQKNRIAHSIGQMVSVHLLDADTLQGSLLSENTLKNIREKISEKILTYQSDERTLEDVLTFHFTEEKVSEYKEKICVEGGNLLMDKISEAELGSYVAQIVEEEIRKKSSSMSILDMMGSVIDNMISSIRGVVKDMMDQQIREKGPELIRTEILKTEENILSMRLCDIYEKHKSKIPGIIDGIVRLYQAALEQNLNKALASLNVEKIVEDKIRTFDAEELENLVFGVMKRELKAIVYLGAFLGFLMGFINLLY